MPLRAPHSSAAGLGSRLRACKGRRGQLPLGHLAAARQRQAGDEHQACRHGCSLQALPAPAQQGLLQVGTAILLSRLRGSRLALCWYDIGNQAHACRQQEPHVCVCSLYIKRLTGGCASASAALKLSMVRLRPMMYAPALYQGTASGLQLDLPAMSDSFWPCLVSCRSDTKIGIASCAKSHQAL